MAIVATGLLGTALPAAAAFTFTTCTAVNGEASFDPGIGFTPMSQRIVMNAYVQGCSPKVATGQLSAELVTSPIECDPPPPGTVFGSGSGSIAWNTGKSSTLRVKLVSLSGGVNKLKGTITAGKFTGTSSNPTKIKMEFKYTSTIGDCVQYPPVTGAGFDNTKDFVVVSKF